jgi:hypothetical protein
MNTTTKMSYDELLRKALSKGKSSSTKKAKFDKKKNYASFWMDDLGKGSDRFGISSDFSGKSSDLVKSIKLNSYRRAVANFVKILTNKEIPVKFKGADSYTDGKSVTISTDIKDDNFDVTVGLALHEASHVLLTDFSILPILRSGNHTEAERIVSKFPAEYHDVIRQVIKDLLNWVEDRRIDNYVFSTSPGYKAYYHKLYDHYFNNDKLVTRGLKAKKYRNPKQIDSWMMHIINMTNEAFNPTVMPGLQEVTSIVNLPQISRLKSTNDALDVVLKMMEVIAEHLDFAPVKEKEQEEQQSQPKAQPNKDAQQEQEDEEEEQEGSESSEEQEDEESEEQQGEGSGSGEGEGDEESKDEGEGDGSGEGEEESEDEGEDITDAEASAIENHMREQKKFGDGEIKKKSGSRSLERKLEQVEKEGVTIEQVGGRYTCLNYDITGKEFIAAASANELIDKLADQRRPLSYSDPKHKAISKEIDELRKAQQLLDRCYFNGINKTYTKAIEEGLLMGQLLGKKLQLRNESRERVDNRLRSGKIDNRRLAAAGYGIESIFQQVTVDKYKKANLHLSLDGSGSMGGTYWANTVKMAMAIAKGLTYTSNVSMQISIRVTTHDKGTLPANYFIYDSRKNTIRELQVVLGSFSPNGMTPEGLCFESMLKKNQLVKSDSELDSYFVNISDGGPGGVGNYSGATAMEHTKAQVTKMRNELGMNVLSYFMTSYTDGDFSQSSSGRMFQGMYGKAATNISPDNVLAIAKTLNNMFMGK